MPMKAKSEAQLHFFLLGALALSKDSQPAPLPYTDTARSLLSYLLLNYPKAQTRNTLAGTLWPEKPDSWARQRLSQALYQINRWQSDFVIADKYTLTLNPDFSFWVDVFEFRQLIMPILISRGERPVVQATRQQRTQTLTQAVLLYRGDLLEGFYEDWILSEREALHVRFLQVLSELIELEKSGNKYSEALEYALKLAQIEPIQEAYHREVMRLQFILQQSEAALKQYALCCQILKEELDQLPEAETVELAQEIAGRSNLQTSADLFLPTRFLIARQQKSALADHLPLIGRENEQALLSAALDETLHGFGHMVLIEGEAGVGKTRLAQELARQAEWHSMQVLWGYASESEGNQPYSPLVQALNNGLTPLRTEELTQLVQPIWLTVLARLLPALTNNPEMLEDVVPLPPAQERERLFYALNQLLTAWSEIRPLALILEDMQWMDEDSLDLLGRLREAVSQGSILIVCTYRGDEARSRPELWEKLQTLYTQSTSQHIHLEQLNAQASAEIIQRTLRLRTPAQLFETRLYQQTNGNPLFILETLRVLKDEGWLYQDADGNWNTTWDEATLDYRELPISPVIEQSISRRLKKLPSNARRMLELVAVAGSQCEVSLLCAASDADPHVLIALLRMLVQHHTLQEAQTHYQFTHEKIRQVVYSEIAVEERTRLHRRFAQALKNASPAQTSALAFHCTRGELWSEAVKVHQIAGKQAEAVFANQLAWEHFSQALEIIQHNTTFGDQEGHEITFDLLYARSKLAWMKGNTAQQEADILALVDEGKKLLDPQRKAEAYIQQAIFLCSAKDEYEKAQQVAEKALKVAEEHTLTRLAASAWQQIGVARQRCDQYSSAIQALQKSIALWQSMPEEDTALAEAMIHLAQVYEHTGDITQAKAQALKVIELAQKDQAPLTLARAFALLGTLTYRENDFSTAIQYNQQALEKARQIGHKHNEAVMLCNLGFAYWALGDYAKTIDYTYQGFEIYRQLGNQRGMVLCCDNLSALYIETGQYSKAQEFITKGLESARQIGFSYEEGLLLTNLGRLYLEQTDCGQEHDMQNAMKAYQQALQVGQSIDSPYVSAGAYLGLGMAMYIQKACDQANIQFTLALENYQNAGESAFATGARSYLAINSLSSGKIQAALELSTQAVADLEAANGGEYVQDIYLHHFLILTAAGQKKAAFHALEKAQQAVQTRASTLPPDWRPSFLTQVSVNRRILNAWENLRPTNMQVRLPRTEAPTGRTLKEDEWVEVSWSVSIASDLEIEGKQELRRARLLRLLEEAQTQGAAPTIDNLSNALDTSPATIKRDLAFLRQSGLKISTRGERSSIDKHTRQ